MAIDKDLKVIENRSFKITVEKTVNDTSEYTNHLRPNWCKCKNSTFLCYPEDNSCVCGIAKHHVHCICGGVEQIG